MTRVNSLLELTNVRSRSRKESGICIIEMIRCEIFSKNLHLTFSWMLRFRSRSKTLQQNLTIVPTWDLNKDYSNDVLVKVPVWDLNIVFPSYILLEVPVWGKVKVTLCRDTCKIWALAYSYEHWDEHWHLISLKHTFCLKIFPQTFDVISERWEYFALMNITLLF